MWGYGPNYGMMGWGYGGYGPIGMIIWLVILVAIVAGAVWFFQRMQQQQQGQPPQLTSGRSRGLDVLEERYARGEIEREEYLQKKHDLAS
ncbi:MAG: SHOCT domain-containing protein [Hyphomicrobiales bacterium]|nr:SHOCT domain-containing protein [Rhodoblastus sp.]MCO5088772.1 SHOCT domain-containing protein [Methylobacteriaceae bacterium]MDE2361147.1 SHOCT domain-containing protein [Hyphomicrobiales bacterium]HRY01634.1 SHOCT domain-containing protein [Beijerinckiaceae bacterium]